MTRIFNYAQLSQRAEGEGGGGGGGGEKKGEKADPSSQQKKKFFPSSTLPSVVRRGKGWLQTLPPSMIPSPPP